MNQDFVEAASWYRRAADRGHAHAMSNLGILHATGRGVERDMIRAVAWFTLAASRTSDPGLRATFAANRERAASTLTRSQVAQAERLAGEWKPK